MFNFVWSFKPIFIFVNFNIFKFINKYYEIIESIILQYPFIIGKKLENPILYLSFNKNKNPSFYNYIRKKYPSIKIGIPPQYDYSINCSIYTSNRRMIKRDKTHFYISHEYNHFLVSFKNVFFVFKYCHLLNSLINAGL